MMDSLTGAGPEMADMPGPVRAVDTSEAVNLMNVGDAVEIGKTMPEGSDARQYAEALESQESEPSMAQRAKQQDLNLKELQERLVDMIDSELDSNTKSVGRQLTGTAAGSELAAGRQSAAPAGGFSRGSGRSRAQGRRDGRSRQSAAQERDINGRRDRAEAPGEPCAGEGGVRRGADGGGCGGNPVGREGDGDLQPADGEAVAAEYGVESILDPENGYYGLVKKPYPSENGIRR